jgi:hypothetical protein
LILNHYLPSACRRLKAYLNGHPDSSSHKGHLSLLLYLNDGHCTEGCAYAVWFAFVINGETLLTRKAAAGSLMYRCFSIVL